MKGRVLWWSQVRGHGFLLAAHRMQVFIHYSSFERNGERIDLIPNQTIEFELIHDPRGPRAIKAKILEG